MKNIVIGILAHVDAGKTTLIESILYNAKTIAKMGRVDHKNTLLDYDEQERDRGITIYAKEAFFEYDNNRVFVIDTPGHMDFSSEMERSLQVLDLAILLISARDGIQSHTKTIWRLLKHYKVPTIIFVNKMDISLMSKEELIKEIQSKLDSHSINYNNQDLCLINDNILNEYLNTDNISNESLSKALYNREFFPIFFGSALLNEGIIELIDAISNLSLDIKYSDEFKARVYKLSYDENNLPLAHIKINGGKLHVKDKINDEEKVDQIRLYLGSKYININEADAGMICVIKGLNNAYVGEGLGKEDDSEKPLLNACMNYKMILPDDISPLEMMKYCNILKSEDPELNIYYDSNNKEIIVSIMGSIQMEILTKKIEAISHVHVAFEVASVIYNETITNEVIGVGHFEPLRHYAEVHIKLEPLPLGSGLKYDSALSSDDLPINFQKQILSHMKDKAHLGVLTSSPITDIKMTLVAAKYHLKHTEGGDFKEATYRAIRQGLLKAQSVLLEPYYEYNLTLPSKSLSKALFDLENKHATINIQELDNGYVEVYGKGPCVELMDYKTEVIAYTSGLGEFSVSPSNYGPCVNQEEVIDKISYNPLHDTENPSSSIFCLHGSSTIIPYDKVEEYMHIPFETKSSTEYSHNPYNISEEMSKLAFMQSGGRNKKQEKRRTPSNKKVDDKKEEVKIEIKEKLKDILIVDGYNMIFSWANLKDLAKTDMHAARENLIDLIVSYQGYKGQEVILVFDGYKTMDNLGSMKIVGNTKIIYTKYGITADSYIEKLVHELKGKYHIEVASSDNLIQNAIFANSAKRISASELESKIKSFRQDIKDTYTK